MEEEDGKSVNLEGICLFLDWNFISFLQGSRKS